jgi:hypothetical protein
MVKAEVAGKKKDPAHDLSLSTSVSSVLMKDFEATISTRAVFILIELIENPETNALVIKHVKEQKAVVQELAKKDKSTGLQILLKKLV